MINNYTETELTLMKNEIDKNNDHKFNDFLNNLHKHIILSDIDKIVLTYLNIKCKFTFRSLRRIIYRLHLYNNNKHLINSRSFEFMMKYARLVRLRLFRINKDNKLIFGFITRGKFGSCNEPEMYYVMNDSYIFTNFLYKYYRYMTDHIFTNKSIQDKVHINEYIYKIEYPMYTYNKIEDSDEIIEQRKEKLYDIRRKISIENAIGLIAHSIRCDWNDVKWVRYRCEAIEELYKLIVKKRKKIPYINLKKCQEDGRWMRDFWNGYYEGSENLVTDLQILRDYRGYWKDD